MTNFQVNVVTKAETILNTDQATAVNLPGIEGGFTVLANHTPLVALLGAGEVIVTEQSGENHRYTISRGTVETSRNVANILIDLAETPAQAS